MKESGNIYRIQATLELIERMEKMIKLHSIKGGAFIREQYEDMKERLLKELLNELINTNGFSHTLGVIMLSLKKHYPELIKLAKKEKVKKEKQKELKTLEKYLLRIEVEKSKLNSYFISGSLPKEAEYKSALQDVLRTFPYFQLAQVMIAKKMQDDNEPEAINQLKIASVYSTNRKSMYILFKKEPENANIKDLTGFKNLSGLATTDNPVAKKEEVRFNYVYNTPAVPESRTTKNSVPEHIDVPAKKPYTAPTIVKKRSYYTAKPNLPPVPHVEKTKPSQTSPAVEIKVTPPPPLVKEKDKEVITPIAAEKEENISSIEIKLKYSFSSWLKVIPEISIEKKPEAKPVSQKESMKLIDKFLVNEPHISRPKKEFFSPVKAAKQSVMEDDELISETLAGIYFEQGNYPKALKAYELLLVQHPEKNTIFAPRMEEIKTLMQERDKR